MQSPGPGLNIPQGSTVPQVEVITTYARKEDGIQVADNAVRPSVVPVITALDHYNPLEVQTTPGASLGPAPVAIQSIPAGNAPTQRVSSVPMVESIPQFQPLTTSLAPGASLLPVFAESIGVAPLANYINSDTTFWAQNQATAGTNSFSTLFVSSLTAGNGAINILTNSTITTTSINIDGQTLDADSNTLFLNGIPIATTSNLSSIADWSLYDAVSTVRMRGNDISSVGTIYANGGNINYIFASSISCEVVAALNDVRTPEILLYNEILPNIDLTMVPSGDKSRLLVNTSTVAFYEDVGDWAFFPALSNVDASTITTSTISAVQVGLVGSTGNGSLTTSADGTSLLFNGSPIAQQSQISSITDWAKYPAVSTIQAAGNNIADVGNFTMSPSLTNQFNLGGGTILTPISANKQYALTTNIVNVSPVTPMEITSLGGINMTANATTGTQEFNITFVGASGNDMNITAPDINLTCTDAYSFMNLTAPAGVTIAGGGLFVASGVLEAIGAGDISLLSGGNVRIGSGNLFGATTQLEKFEYTDDKVEPMNGIRRLLFQNIEISNVFRDAGSEGTFSGRMLINCRNDAFTNVQSATSNNQQVTWQVQADQSGSVYKSMNLISVGSNQPIRFNMSANGNSFLTTYNSGNLITYGSSGGDVQLAGVGTINASVQLSAPVGTFTNLNLQTASISSLNVSTINADSIIASTIATPYFLVDSNTVALGFGTLASVIGNNNVSIGNDAGLLNQGLNTVAVGFNAGRINQSTGSVAIGGSAANAGQNEYSIALGFRAANNGLRSNSIYIGGLPVGQNETFIENNAIVLNASGTPLIGTNPNAFYVRSLRQPPDKLGYYTVGYNPSNNEVAYTTTIGLDNVSTTVGNTQQITYDTGLLTTSIGGILQGNQAQFTQTVAVDTTLNVLQTANISSLQLYGIANESAPNALFYNSTTTKVSYAPITTIVAEPAFVYYVATNGRAGARGTITDPLSTIAEALTKPAKTGAVDPPGMVIYVATGAYSEDIVIPISLTLPSVSIIGMSTDTDDSKQVQIRGSVTITGTDVTLVNTVNSVTINNIAIFAKNTGATTAVTMTGRGYRVYLQNGLYTSPVAISVPLISLAGTNGIASNALAQLVINNCSMSCPSGSTGNIVSVSGGVLFEIRDSDLTQRGTTALALGVTGGTFSAANNTNFEGAGPTVSLAFTAAGLANFTNCLIRGVASPTVAILTLGANANLNLSNNTIQNLNTVEANNTSRYVYVTSAGLLIASIRNNFSSSATTPITQMTPYQATTASLALYYFANIYSNAQNSVEENLPVWASVRQFGNDLLIPQFQVTATSATPIALNASVRGRTYILTGTTTQPFTTTGLTATDAGFCVIVHNGNGTGLGDINITGATGTTIVHNRTLTQNGQNLYLFWNGLTLVGY